MVRQFLYPSEEDLYKLVRFLVGRLAESSSSEAQKASDEKNITVEVIPQLEELRLENEALESARLDSGDTLVRQLNESDSSLSNLGCSDDGVQESTACFEDSANSGRVSEIIVQDSVGTLGGSRKSFSENEETVDLGVQEYVDEHDQQLSSLEDNSSKVNLLAFCKSYQL